MTAEEKLKVSEIQVEVVGYLENGTSIIVYKCPNPAEIYEIPRNWGNYRV